MTGRVLQVNVSPGGVPKLPVEGPVDVGRLGLAGDGHNEPTLHGGPHRAVCLFAKEAIDRVAAEGHPIHPGSCGENLTTEGLELATFPVGTRLAIGPSLVLELSAPDGPCSTIEDSFSDRRFARISILTNPTDSRMYARVLVEGPVAAGDAIAVLPPDPASRAPEWPLLTRIDAARRDFWLANWRASAAGGMDLRIVDDGELAMVAAPTFPGPWRNRVYGLTIIPNLVDRAVAFFGEHGVTGWADLEPADAARLDEHPTEADADRRSAWFAAPVGRIPMPAVPDVTIREIDAAEVGAFADVLIAADPSDADLEAWRRRMAESMLGTQAQAHRHLFLAELDGRIVGAAGLFTRNKVGWMAAAGVIPEARGRGIQRALIGARARVAAELGCDTVAADAEPGSVSAANLAAMGLQRVAETVTVPLPPAGARVA